MVNLNTRRNKSATNNKRHHRRSFNMVASRDLKKQKRFQEWLKKKRAEFQSKYVSNSSYRVPNPCLTGLRLADVLGEDIRYGVSLMYLLSFAVATSIPSPDSKNENTNTLPSGTIIGIVVVLHAWPKLTLYAWLPCRTNNFLYILF